MIDPLLVFGIGNPSRGDDALGPAFVDAIGDRAGIGVLVDHQLQVEHALDLRGRERVLFVDASVSAAPPFEIRRVVPRASAGVSHALSPEELLGVAETILETVPPTFVLGIRGAAFELGDPLSARARAHLAAALTWFDGWIGAPSARVGWRIGLQGRVQGVGCRPWIVRTATSLGLDGRVWNTGDGVTIEAAGAFVAMEALLAAVQRDLPAGAVLSGVTLEASPWPGSGPPAAERSAPFTIAPSTTGAGRLTLVPDTAICPECLAETEVAGRFYRYPLTSCATCGPRFAMIEALPWDRAHTSMAPFPLCPACAAAYADGADRRFHAQGSACGVCGPRVWIEGVDGEPIPSLARAIRDGAIAAVQGVGAFHLVADATSAEALEALRRRKHRETQPFAVMVADVAAAHTVAVLTEADVVALTSPAHPIVIVPSKGVLAATIAPTTRRIGVMLPYTALHHALIAEVGGPLVVTSANQSGLPAITRHADARRELVGIADVFCLHDRAITHRVEDSVVLGGPSPRLVRAARGFAPLTVQLPAASPEPILAVGGHQKTTVTIVVDDQAFVSPHLGDLNTVEAEERYLEEVAAFERLLGVSCRIVAHDLHPAYATTRYALGRGGRTIGVQHHAAHVYATLAEHPLDEPVVGLAIDGTGWGPDGTSWGAEVVIVDGATWTRVGTARPIPLPGGEAAIRAPWRAALGLLVDTYGSDADAVMDALPVFASVDRRDRDVLVRMVAQGLQCPGARGVGRSFDAIAAIVLGIGVAGHDAHAAVALEEAAVGDGAAYPYRIEGITLDLRPAVRVIVDDVLAGVDRGRIAARFHATWADGLATLVADALATANLRRVVLGGGALLNQRLLGALVARLGADRVVVPKRVPCNDGGLSLGQAWAATLTLRREA